MAQMYSNVENPRIKYGDRSQLSNWILDSCATCHMTPDILDFILGSLVETDKYTKFPDGNFFTSKQRG